ncbi:MAG: hypothetical protein QCI82_10890 [Candidatus Thermoplasmatota archaeon]|nr:hypothetical protein [Candidatus Thermoplasmatota archaeon]
MGRTCPTYRMLLEFEIDGWRDYSRSLEGRDKEALEWLFDAARRRASACGAACRLNPFEAMIMAFMVSIESLEMEK